MSAPTLSATELPSMAQWSRQRNFAISCYGIVVLLQTLVAGSLFIITGDKDRKCIEIKIAVLQSTDVSATVMTLSVDGVLGKDEAATVKVEVLEPEAATPDAPQGLKRSPAFYFPRSGIHTATPAPSSSPAIQPPSQSAASPSNSALVVQPPLQIEAPPNDSFESSGSTNRSQVVLVSQSLVVSISSQPEASGSRQLALAPRPAPDNAIAVSPRSIQRSPAFCFRDGYPSSRPAPQLASRPAPLLLGAPPNRASEPSGSASEFPSASRRPPRARRTPRATGSASNPSASPSMPPPPTLATPSPKKRGTSEVCVCTQMVVPDIYVLV
ncbi:hypothetical protein DFH09DRAFT_1167739 [Mycena vulgaris]|nr:hypothetical protein DFH09DRAFT_1167739 [Mycena vulgaris]